ncbi:Leucine aminopeptidase 1, partial [Ascosphaera atra]
MKLLPYLALATSAATAAAAAIALDQPNGAGSQNPLGDMLEEDKFLVESQPGKTHWVTEDEKWALKRAGVNFIDITSEQVAGPQAAALHTRLEPVTYPDTMQHADKIRSLATHLSKQEMHDHLTLLTSFHTRYYKSADGVKSATWLYHQVLSTLDGAGAREYGATVEKVLHPWGQFSIVARIPGATNET